ncbi:hypothetical protein Taro_021575 [Colocasia esculenta]|uniref:Uncharacterized protein n=1 Tax=Colocasia esculenta TaxID=4460 RepID=A0A843UZG2_COLES|nr:hypothetical protein [Colocasia esculenta]
MRSERVGLAGHDSKNRLYNAFYVALSKVEAFKGFKRGVCLGRDFNQNFKCIVSARQSRGGSVRHRGDAVKLLRRGFPSISTSVGSCGAGTTRGRRPERGCSVNEEVLASSSWC